MASPTPSRNTRCLDRLPTGILDLDLALDGGLPTSGIVEIVGKHHSGKTTLALQLLGQAQRAGLRACYVCGSRLPSEGYMTACGIDALTLHVPGPQKTATLEGALAYAVGALNQDDTVVVLDSLPAFPTRNELDCVEFDSGRKHLRPAILDAYYAMACACQRLNPNTLLAIVNQLRYKPGVFFGDPWEPTCGQVTDHFQARLRLDRVQALKEGGQTIGSRIRVRIKKNAGGTPWQEVEFNILNHGGPDTWDSILNVALNLAIVTEGNGHFYLGDVALGRGRTGAKARLRELYYDGHGKTIQGEFPNPALLPAREAPCG